MKNEISSLMLRPTWAEISFLALAENLTKAKETLGKDKKLMFVVKANAYGHGAKELSSFAEKNKLADFLGVSSIEEGIYLRQNKINLPILVLGSIYPFTGFEAALKYDLSVTIASTEAAREISECAAKLKTYAKCHVKVETGMGRIGVRKTSALKTLEFLNQAPNVEVEGTYTHLSSADCDTAYTRQQLKYFADTINAARIAGYKTGIKHVSNSHGLNFNGDASWDMARTGLCAYGLMEGYKPILALKSKIVYIKDVRKGASISYGRSWRCAHPSKIATLPIGYADGYQRACSNRSEVLIQGRRCRVIGNVTMDMVMADVTHLPNAQVGDEVVLIGAQHNDEITAGDLANLAGTIPYEIMTGLSARLARIYGE